MPVKYHYNIGRIEKIRKELTGALAEFIGTRPRGDDFSRLIDIVSEVLNGRCHRPTLIESLQHLTGYTLDEKTLKDTAWRIAANLHRINRHRIAVPPWIVQRLLEWVPLQIVKCTRTRSGSGVAGATYRVRVLAGTPCPRLFDHWWSLKQCRYFAKSFGFSHSNREDAHPFAHPEDFVSLRFYGLLDPDLCGQEPNFDVAAWPSSVLAWNKTIIRHRLRILPDHTCPKQHPNTFPCLACPVPFTACKGSVHRLEWVRGSCTACGQSDVWFDPEHTGLCVSCYYDNAYRRKHG